MVYKRRANYYVPGSVAVDLGQVAGVESESFLSKMPILMLGGVR